MGNKPIDPTMKLALKIVRTLRKHAQDGTRGMAALKIAVLLYSEGKEDLDGK